MLQVTFVLWYLLHVILPCVSGRPCGLGNVLAENISGYFSIQLQHWYFRIGSACKVIYSGSPLPQPRPSIKFSPSPQPTRSSTSADLNVSSLLHQPRSSVTSTDTNIIANNDTSGPGNVSFLMYTLLYSHGGWCCLGNGSAYPKVKSSVLPVTCHFPWI